MVKLSNKLLKYSTIALIFMLVHIKAEAQDAKELTLEDCYRMARENYPLIKQKDLLNLSTSYSVSNANKAYLPQFTINGQASYQSDVTSIDIKIPGFPAIVPPSKDQYKIYAELNQVLYDGGATGNQKKLLKLSNEAENQKTEVELYKIKDRINQLFFGILLIDEQLKQVELIKSDLNESIKKTNIALSNGTAYQSNLNLLKAELLKADQRTLEFKSSRKSFIAMLSLFIAKELPESSVFIKPQPNESILTTIKRPELSLFSLQQSLLDQQLKLNNTKNLPKASLFLQGGYGKPGLNVLKNEFVTYYIGGLRLNWNLSNFYTNKNDHAISGLNKQIIDNQKDIFLFNTQLSITQQSEETNKLSQLIKLDEEILSLKTKIKNASKVQLENGIITTSDYLREFNAEDQAKSNLILHQIQLLQAQSNLKTTTGN